MPYTDEHEPTSACLVEDPGPCWHTVFVLLEKPRPGGPLTLRCPYWRRRYEQVLVRDQV